MNGIELGLRLSSMITKPRSIRRLLRSSFDFSKRFMPNQFTKGTRTEHDEATKDRIRAELLSKKYYKFAMASAKRQAKMGITKEQVAAAKMLIDKGKPSLQSVESKETDPMESMTLEEQMEQLRTLITTHPEFIQALGLSFSPSQVSVNEPTQLVPTITKPIESTGT